MKIQYEKLPSSSYFMKLIGRSVTARTVCLDQISEMGWFWPKLRPPNETYLSQPITLCKLVKWLCGSYAIHSSLVERLVHYLTRVCLSWGRLLTEAGAQSVEYCSHLVRHCRRGSWRQTAAGTNTSQSPVQVSVCVCVWVHGGEGFNHTTTHKPCNVCRFALILAASFPMHN